MPGQERNRLECSNIYHQTFERIKHSGTENKSELWHDSKHIQKLSKRRKKSVQTEMLQSTDDIDLSIKTENHRNDAHISLKTSSVQDAQESKENRKKSIKAKLLIRKEYLLSQEEGQDIHTRAELYAITTVPEPKYCILPTDGSAPRPQAMFPDFHKECMYPPVQKKRRRNYGTTNCYVTHHNYEDMFDNTKMLPIGTQLVKPPTKLVELVAQAISGSPDGLLQVQQIYTFLQNKYPFFRYMDRVAINSWRSSIRHALYQKWFRKIRFDSSFISSKGCYWAINGTSNPKEWSLPENSIDLDADDEKFYFDTIESLDDENEIKKVAAISRQPLGEDRCDDEDEDVYNTSLTELSQTDVPSPVKEPDPVLATCTAHTWSNEDIYLSSAESGHGTMTSEDSPCIGFLSQETQEVTSDILHISPQNITPGSSKTSVTSETSAAYSVSGEKYRQYTSKADFSPMIHWIPNWEEYGSYIISPQNLATQRYVLGLPGNRNTDCNNNFVKSAEEESKSVDFKSVCGLLDGMESLNDLPSSSGSESGSYEFEIIAEYTKSEKSADELSLEY